MRKKENITVQPVSVWGQPLEAVFVQIIPPANQEEADQDFYDENHAINGTDYSFLSVAWRFNTGAYKVVGSEQELPNYERLFSQEWITKIGDALLDSQYELSTIDRAKLLTAHEKISPFTLFLLFFGKNKYRQIIREAGLSKEEITFVCGEILFEANQSALMSERAFINNLVYSLYRGKF
jgi:hypothetical protein